MNHVMRFKKMSDFSLHLAVLCSNPIWSPNKRSPIVKQKLTVLIVTYSTRRLLIGMHLKTTFLNAYRSITDGCLCAMFLC